MGACVGVGVDLVVMTGYGNAEDYGRLVWIRGTGVARS
jgi:hypothetical protein